MGFVESYLLNRFGGGGRSPGAPSLHRRSSLGAHSRRLDTYQHAGVERSHERQRAVGRGLSATDLCESAGRQAFEACPFYLGEVEAAVTIRRVFPTLRTVAILRNPRELTTSAFNDYVRLRPCACPCPMACPCALVFGRQASARNCSFRMCPCRGT